MWEWCTREVKGQGLHLPVRRFQKGVVPSLTHTLCLLLPLNMQGKMIDAEILRAHHSRLAVEQRETFRRQRAEQAARYSRSGVLPSRTYSCDSMTAPGPHGHPVSRGSGMKESTIPGSSRQTTSNWGSAGGVPGGYEGSRPATFPGTGPRVGGHQEGLTGEDGAAGGSSSLSYPGGKEDDAIASTYPTSKQPYPNSVPGVGKGDGAMGSTQATPTWAELYGTLGSAARLASAWGSIPSVSSSAGGPRGRLGLRTAGLSRAVSAHYSSAISSLSPSKGGTAVLLLPKPTFSRVTARIYAEEQDAVVSQAEAVRLAAAEVASAKERAVIALEMQALDDFDMGIESAGRAKLGTR